MLNVLDMLTSYRPQKSKFFNVLPGSKHEHFHDDEEFTPPSIGTELINNHKTYIPKHQPPI